MYNAQVHFEIKKCYEKSTSTTWNNTVACEVENEKTEKEKENDNQQTKLHVDISHEESFKETWMKGRIHLLFLLFSYFLFLLPLWWWKAKV